MSGSLHAGVPTAPLVDPLTGQPTPAWRAFLLALYSRTGSGPGVSADAQAQALLAESNARQAGDVAQAAAVAAETTQRLAADATERTAREAADAALAGRIPNSAALLSRWWFWR